MFVVWLVIGIGICVALAAALVLTLCLRRWARQARQLATEFDEVSVVISRISAAVDTLQRTITDSYNSSEKPGRLPGK